MESVVNRKELNSLKNKWDSDKMHAKLQTGELMKILLLLIGAPLFMLAAGMHIYVKIAMRPKNESDLDDIYWEFEQSHQQLAKYDKWSQITFVTAIIGILMLFLALIF